MRLLFPVPRFFQQTNSSLVNFRVHTCQMSPLGCLFVCVCCHPIYSGRQTCGRHQPGSHRTSPPSFYIQCLHSFLWREGFSRPFPSSTVKSNFVHSQSNRSPLGQKIPVPVTARRFKLTSQHQKVSRLQYQLDHRGTYILFLSVA